MTYDNDYPLSRWHESVLNKTSGTGTVIYYLTKADFAFGSVIHVHMSCRTKSQSGDMTLAIKNNGDGATIVSFIVALVNGRTDSFECDIPITSIWGYDVTSKLGLGTPGISTVCTLTGNGATHYSVEVHVG